MSSNLDTDPLFIGLTRPTMLFGVSLEYAMLNFMISTIFFIQKSSIYIIFISAVIHLIGYLLCFKEPRFMAIYMNYFDKCNKCTNKSYYGANSYDI